MTNLTFTDAVRSEAKARVAMIGPTGAGKTWTALQWARTLAGPTGTIGVIDTENASASLYSDQYEFKTAAWYPPYDPAKLAAAIGAAARQFDVLIIDSLTHFWQGDGGVLDIVEQEGAKVGSRGNNFAGWKKGTPLWRGILDALIFAPCHVVITMRSKMDYVQQPGQDGRMKVEKMGMAPVARNDVEYEFTIVCELDQGHRLTVTKSRCSALADRTAAPHQSGALADVLVDWLSSAAGDPATPPSVPRPQGDVTDAQIRKMMAAFGERDIKDRAARLAFLVAVVERDIESSKELTKDEARKVIDAIEAMPIPEPGAAA